MLNAFTYKTTAIRDVPARVRDELIGCQHPTEDSGSTVYMDNDYVFDASLDESISKETRSLLKEALDNYSDSLMFSFNP